MSKIAVTFPYLPKTLPVFSQAIVHGDTIYCSGLVGFDAATGILAESFTDQTVNCLRNLEHVLKAAGSSMENALKVNIYVKDVSRFAELNEVYINYFGDVKPARTCVEVTNLPVNAAQIEMECVAYK
ncbi:unnamed protein product [Kuraishia capsulata CBS 1993]|uniref:Uncharacterized protein n=1 Tax=Kuraishia capsulata CBS 1993 TaxID=1382522 RepID=W6ML09_9ASCO|nr:uncharacterized protein KUCA_T00003121001 [Kuraishia capsulata CBS 1993]CDK27144.1 unnamed protein product [Kuraishia capsulata CBS 1993]